MLLLSHYNSRGEIWTGYDGELGTGYISSISPAKSHRVVIPYTAGWSWEGQSRIHRFNYLADNAEVTKRGEELAWNFDLLEMGYEWDEGQCQDYQWYYPGGLGYQVL